VTVLSAHRVGHVYVKAQVAARRRASVEFLVDTGATHTIIPPALAKEIGAPILPQRFTVSLADGSRRRLQACSLGLTIAGRSGPTIALLLPGGEPLLGVEALEALGLKVNPQRRRLEPSRAAGALLVGVRAPHLRRSSD
jgi:aspartyl protease family protein